MAYGQHSLIIGLDISKGSTGISFLDVAVDPESNLLDISVLKAPSSIKIPNSNFYDKAIYEVSEFLISRIIDELHEAFDLMHDKYKGQYNHADTKVIIELPIIKKNSSSNQSQFFLFTSILHSFNNDIEKIDCFCFSPLFVKAFAKQFAPHVHTERIANKNDMSKLYTEMLMKIKIDDPQAHLEQLKTDDEVDAMFLALIGAISISPFFTSQTPIITQEQFHQSIISLDEEMLNIWKDYFPQLLLLTPEGTTISTQSFLKKYKRDFINADPFNPRSSSFFAFRYLSNLETFLTLSTQTETNRDILSEILQKTFNLSPRSKRYKELLLPQTRISLIPTRKFGLQPVHYKE